MSTISKNNIKNNVKQAWKFSSITSLSQVSQLWSKITRQRIGQGWGDKPPPPSFVRSINPKFIQKLIRTEMDQFRFDPIWSILIQLDLIWTDHLWFSLIWFNLVQLIWFVLLWSNLNQLDLIWSSLNQFYLIWTNLN